MSKNQGELFFVPLGGVGEIGMNLALYGYKTSSKREWIMVDVGISFPDERYPGIDFIVPDIRFVQKNLSELKGIIITHGHEDHYGALHELLPFLDVPVWMTPFAAGLFSTKRKRQKDTEDFHIKIYDEKKKFSVGSFSIEAIPVAHSIPETMALAISTPAGTVIHTGDWRIDETPIIDQKTDEKRFRALGEKGVLALICDSTNSLVEGQTISEKTLGLSLLQIMKEAKGRVVIGTFSSNVSRIISIARAAKEAGRQVLVLGQSLHRVIDVARELGYLDGLEDFADERLFQSIPRENLVVICTGSQGEETAALAKISRKELKTSLLTAGDTIIFSSRTIPGNEKAVVRVKNRFIDMGLKVIEEDEALIHVSGHARREELKKMYTLTQPQIGIPVHGEPIHLSRHAAFMKECGLKKVIQMRNGDLMRLSPGEPSLVDKVPFGSLYKDGFFLGNEEEIKIAERRKLSFSGHVVVIADLYFDSIENLEILMVGIPDFLSRDFVAQEGKRKKGASTMQNCVEEAAEDAILSLSTQKRKNLNLLQDAIARNVRSEIKKLWGKTPLVSVICRYS